jgi:prepilin-type processing-associated H-X9-DG protein
MYANEAKGGGFPPVTPLWWFFWPSAGSIYPEYWTDPMIAVCPSDSQAKKGKVGAGNPAGQLSIGVYEAYQRLGECDGPGSLYILDYPASYTYYPYLAENASEFLLYIGAWNDVIWPAFDEYALTPFDCSAFDAGDAARESLPTRFIDKDLSNTGDGFAGYDAGRATVTGDSGPFTLYKLREGVERFTITDINNPAASALAQSSVAVMWDHWALANVDPAIVGGSIGIALYNHVPGGCNVLYMDGHVEWVRQGAKYPVPSAAGGVVGDTNTPAGAAATMGNLMNWFGGGMDIM